MVNGLIAGLSITIILLVTIMAIIINNLSYRIDQLQEQIDYIEKHYQIKPENHIKNYCKLDYKDPKNEPIDVDEYLGYKDFDVDKFLKQHDPEIYKKINNMD